MQVTVKNLELSPQVNDYVERKLEKLGKYVEITELNVEITEQKTRSRQQRYTVQVTLDSDGTKLRGEERGEELLSTIDRVTQVIERQVERFKSKRSPRKGQPTVRETPVEGPVSPKVVKNKHFVLKNLTLEDAGEQMELLGHDFFLFVNRENGKLNLLYRRKDGDYGVIEPDIV